MRHVRNTFAASTCSECGGAVPRARPSNLASWAKGRRPAREFEKVRPSRPQGAVQGTLDSEADGVSEMRSPSLRSEGASVTQEQPTELAARGPNECRGRPAGSAA